MEVVFDGSLRVHYSQAHVFAGGEWDGDVSACFRGQANGLLGAARPGFLFLVTSLHTGHVGLEVRVAEGAPPLEDDWEECVEASLPVLDRPVRLRDWDGSPVCEMPLAEGEYRVRYCARGMDAGRGATPSEAADPIDAYQLTFWPAPPEPDRVLRQTSRTAAYWHKARQLPSPSPPPAVDPATERVRDVRGHGGVGLLLLDPELVREIARADPAVQRALARWAAHRACEVARLADVAWVAPALDALDRGRDLPPPFDTSPGPLRALERDARVPRTLVAPPAGGPPSVPQQSAALPAIVHAVHEDSLSAALNALFSAVLAFGSNRSILLDEVRRAFLIGPAH